MADFELTGILRVETDADGNLKVTPMGFGARSLNPGDVLPPTVPVVTATLTDRQQITVTWGASTDVSGVAEYRIRQRGEAGYLTHQPNDRSHVYSNLQPESVYQFEVAAVDTYGNVSLYGLSNPVATLGVLTPPVWTLAPTSVSLPDTGGTIQFTANDVNGDVLTYSISQRTGFSINASTGLVSVTPAAAGTSGNIQVSVTDGTFTINTTCSVAVAAVLNPSLSRFLIPASPSPRTFSGSNYPLRAGGTAAPVAGDVIELASGTHGSFRFVDLVGTANNPIILRGPSAGVATIRRASMSAGYAATGWVVDFRACRYFVFSGKSTSGSANKALPTDQYGCGIKITYAVGATPTNQDPVQVGVKFTASATLSWGMTDHALLEYIEVDLGWDPDPTKRYSSNGIGFHPKDGNPKKANYPTMWYDTVEISHCIARNCEGEGFYVGCNNYEGAIPGRNLNLHHCLAENTGWDGIQVKNWQGGTNLVHHNRVINCGWNPDTTTSTGQYWGISCTDGPYSIYNNYVEGNADAALQHYVRDTPSTLYSFFASEIYNNVIVDCGNRNFTYDAGITTGHRATSVWGGVPASVRPRVYQNTIIRAHGTSIKVGGIEGTTGSFIKDNVIADCGTNTPSGAASVTNNLAGTVAYHQFVNAGAKNFRLTATSPARNTGTTTGLTTDHDDNVRPKGSAIDCGAFEYQE